VRLNAPLGWKPAGRGGGGTADGGVASWAMMVVTVAASNAGTSDWANFIMIDS